MIDFGKRLQNPGCRQRKDMLAHAERFSLWSRALTIFVQAAATSLLACSLAWAQLPEAKRLFDRGVELNQTGILVEASVLFTEALAIDPEYAEAYYQRGLSFQGMGRHQHAMKDFLAATGYGIRRLDPYLRLIKWHTDRREFAAVLIVTDQLAAHMPENAAGAHWDKGKTYEQMQKNTLAIAAYRAALDALDSDNADFANVLTDRIEELEN